MLAEDPVWWARDGRRAARRGAGAGPGFANLLWQAASVPGRSQRDRLHGYAEKAMREAGDRTTWTDPDPAYEKAVHAMVDAAYDDDAVRAIIDSAAERMAAPGWSNALSAKLVSLTIPGVPDVYQGSELWEQSLVDPDNRRSVDYGHRTSLLADAGTPERPTRLDDDGRAKLHVVRTALRLRRDHPDLFSDYTSVSATGSAAGHVLAFDRGGVIAVVTRLPLGLARSGGWGDTRLEMPDGDLARCPHRPPRRPRRRAAARHPAGRAARPGGRMTFEVWAPRASRVRLEPR